MFGRTRHVKIIKAQRNAAVYIDGRYLHVDMKISTRSKNGRQIARETAAAILNEVMTSEDARDLMNQLRDSAALAANPRTIVQDPPAPPDSFTREEGQAAVRAVVDD